MLRSYDPQIGRFLQNDPYDQFASGYVGMGNDPGNNVDPTGGFSGPGVGCAATAGMAGYGGMAARMASMGSISQTLSTVLSISSTAMKGASLVSNISATSSLSSPASSSSSVYNGGGGASSTGNYDDEGGDNPCNCPPGFSSTPPSSNALSALNINIDLSKPPFYRSEYDVITYYSLMVKDVVGKEYSGLIYSLDVKLKSGSTIRMYSITGFEPGGELSSPGPDGLKHLLPKDAVAVAHIHNHYEGLDAVNKTFSGLITSRDKSDIGVLLKDGNRWNNINYWVLGSTGYLSKYFADNTPAPKNSSSGGDAGQIQQYKSGDNFYINPPSPPPCPCFKIK